MPVSRALLVIVNVAAGLLLSGMTDLASSTRLVVAAILAVNLLLLIGKRSLKGPARLGAFASLVGYAASVVSWLVLAIGCGIEYFNARCDAVVTPVIAACVMISLVSLPASGLWSVLVRRDR